ncbi:MAG: hypothetical protein M3Z07_03470, partial [Candidatus Eremiobacteraeota bacterium]|nr:hypothetical protein [Candidatus Eremiobacteraeota bacterium]
VRAAWPDSRLGTPDTGRQEIAFAKIAVPQDHARATNAVEHVTESAPPFRPPQMEAPDPAKPCRGTGPRAVFLAYEAVPDELAGLRYFVSDWGSKKHCFSGRVATNSAELAKSDYDVAIIDVSPDMSVPQNSIDDIANAMRRGKPVAVFVQPANFRTQSDAPDRIAALRRIFPGLTMTRTCANSQFANVTGGPFDLTDRSFHYESFVHGVYDVGVSGRSTRWALDLCKTRKPTVVRTARGIVAGFYLAYEVSLADNNAPAITAKRLVVNVIHELARQ